MPSVTVAGTSTVPSAAASSFTVPVPAGAQGGDLFVVMITSGQSTNGDINPPDASWTSTSKYWYSSSPGSTKPYVRAHYIELPASPPASYVFTNPTNLQYVPGIGGYALRPSSAGGTWSVTEAGSNDTKSGTTVSAPSLSLPDAGVTIVGVGVYAYGDSLVSPGSPFVQAYSGVISGRAGASGYQTYSSPTTAGPWSFTSSGGSNILYDAEMTLGVTYTTGGSSVSLVPSTAEDLQTAATLTAKRGITPSVSEGISLSATLDVKGKIPLDAALVLDESLSSSLDVSRSLDAAQGQDVTLAAELTVQAAAPVALDASLADDVGLSTSLVTRQPVGVATLAAGESLAATLRIKKQLATWALDQWNKAQEDVELFAELDTFPEPVPPPSVRMIRRRSETYPNPTLVDGRPA